MKAMLREKKLLAQKQVYLKSVENFCLILLSVFSVLSLVSHTSCSGCALRTLTGIIESISHFISFS